MASTIGWNRRHWLVRIDGKKYLSHQFDIGDAIFSACRRHDFKESAFHQIEASFAVRPPKISFKEYQRRIETA